MYAIFLSRSRSRIDPLLRNLAYSAAAAAAREFGTPTSPRGRRSYTMKSHAISRAPAEKTTSPGIRIHCQNRYWS